MIDNLKICMQFRKLRLKSFFRKCSSTSPGNKIQVLVTMVNYRTREGGHWHRAHPHDADELKFK